MKCKFCGKEEDLRLGCCFDCASNGEHIAAHRTVMQHLRKAATNIRKWRWDYVRFDLKWALSRLTRSGDYRHDGYFDREQPCWRTNSCQPT